MNTNESYENGMGVNKDLTEATKSRRSGTGRCQEGAEAAVSRYGKGRRGEFGKKNQVTSNNNTRQ